MDPKLFEQIFIYKTCGIYPFGIKKEQKYVIRRLSFNFQVDEFHASPYGAHCGTEKTKLAISSRFYWPGMGVDIDKWVLQCADCQFSRLSRSPSTSQYVYPLELLGMDLVGKVTRTKKGNEYICVLVDYYTKWAEAYAIPNKSATVVSRCIINFFYRFGAPKRILTDQGTEFVNQINRELCGFLSVERSHRHRLKYHPQTNGLVEKLNGTIQRALCKLVDSQSEKWDEYLDAVMFGLRTKTQLTTRLLLDEPQLKRREETSPSPVDITITKEEQPPPSPPSSPTAPKLSPRVSPKSSSSLSPLDLSMPLSSPVSHPTTVPTVIPADAKDAVHSCIKSAWAGNDSVVLLSKVGPHKLFYQDILKFGPRKELEMFAKVINAYLMLKVRQHNLTSPEKAFHMNTFAITAMWNGKYQGLKVNPANYDVIVGIVNECHHWFLVVSVCD
ncbi:gag-pol fusion [Labeo rohita]|uniref:Gypsy retrotransposon integrase-like protein 1 n=1 Tax=Labeo rohita TaxID=84645 RepID=A0A498NMB0_LABRO|nr:gag-pol fusion [Labeo rohita]RXN33130.1 gag-pol fusion [Labeo rohita]